MSSVDCGVFQVSNTPVDFDNDHCDRDIPIGHPSSPIPPTLDSLFLNNDDKFVPSSEAAPIDDTQPDETSNPSKRKSTPPPGTSQPKKKKGKFDDFNTAVQAEEATRQQEINFSKLKLELSTKTKQSMVAGQVEISKFKIEGQLEV